MRRINKIDAYIVSLVFLVFVAIVIISISQRFLPVGENIETNFSPAVASQPHALIPAPILANSRSSSTTPQPTPAATTNSNFRPANFRGPSGPPHINGPSGPPPG